MPLAHETVNVGVTATSFLKDAALVGHLRESLPAYVNLKLLPMADHASESELVHILQDIDIWLVGREPCTEWLLQRLPRLRWISKYGVGQDNIDLLACERHSVTVYCEAGVNRDSVAEHTLGLMLALLRNIGPLSARLRHGVWHKDGGTDLSRKKVGIVGLGHIGHRVGQLLRSFQCELAYSEVRDVSIKASEISAHPLEFRDLLSWSDIVSFHVPLTDLTRYMLNTETLKFLKPTSFLVNTSRGPVFDQAAVRMALEQGKIAGLAMDVYEVEPLKDTEFFNSDRLVGTPHVAGNSREAVKAMGLSAIRGVLNYLEHRSH